MTDKKNQVNQVVVTDDTGVITRTKTEAEIEKENMELEESLGRGEEEATPQTSAAAAALDPTVLAKLQEKKIKKSKEEEESNMSTTAIAKRDRSLYFGVVGLGQGGSRLAETFYSLGYEACVMNTATQDLEFIEVPENRKLFLPFALGGAGKELDNGRAAIEQNKELVLGKLEEIFDDKQEMMILAVSGGGGTGSGGAEAMIDLLGTMGKPVGVIYILPMDSEDSLSKHNSVTTLGRLAKLASMDAVTTLIVVDNAKIELIYPGMSKAEFWTTANNAIVEPLHMFNHLSVLPTRYESLDSMDFSRILTVGDCITYGMMEVSNYMETTAIAEGIIDNLQSSLLASDFDLKEARFGGFMITGNPQVLQNLPAQNIDYAQHMISESCDYAQLVRGVYELPIEKDVVRVYVMFSGLGLPMPRVNALKEEAREQMDQIRDKEKTRASRMSVDYGAGTDTQNKTKEIRRMVAQKKSGFGKLTSNANKAKVVDRRRR